MTLAELKPRWVHQKIFVFLCPHCRRTWLSCKSVPMVLSAQMGIFAAKLTDDFERANVVPCKADTAWIIEGVLPNVSVTPSLDAGASGHWHGWIKNGMIV